MSLKEKTQSLFAETFGYPATHTIQAPGRVNTPIITTASFCPAPSTIKPSSVVRRATIEKFA